MSIRKTQKSDRDKGLRYDSTLKTAYFEDTGNLKTLRMSSVQLAADLYGLSSAEAKLAASLTKGATLDSIASEHHRSIHTVRAQLKQVLQKTNTHSQADLVRLILGSERRRAEDALSKNRSLLAEAQRIAHIGSWDVDLVNDAFIWSDEVSRIWEIDKTSFNASFAAFLETVHPDDRGRVSRAYNNSIIHHALFEIEHRLLFPDGRVKYILERGEPHYDADGKPMRFIGTSQDITERRLAEVEKRRLLAILEESADYVGSADMEGNIQYSNLAARRMQGLPAGADISALHISDMHPEWAAKRMLETVLPEVMKHGFWRGESALLHHCDGHEIPVSQLVVLHRDADGKPEFLSTIMQDITERKQMEDALRKNLSLLDDAQRIAHIGCWELDLTCNVLTWSDEIFRIFEIDPQQFGASYEAFLDTVHPGDRDAVNRAYTESLEKRVPYDIEHRLRMADGRIKYVHERCETHYAEDGAPLNSIGTVQDITERKRMEAVLIAREHQLHSLGESSPGMMTIYHIRPDGSVCIPYVSPNIWDFFGLRPQDVVDDASSLLARHHPDDDQRVMESIAESAKTMIPWREEFRILHPTKGERWMEGHSNPEPHPDGGVVLYGYVHDVTERKHLDDLRKLARHREAMREEERRHMAHELHEKLAQQLAALRLGMNLMNLRCCPQEPQLQETFRDLLNLLDNSIQLTRDIASASRPVVLDMGIVPALEWLTQEFSQRTGISCELACAQGENHIPEDQAIVLFRIAQEALTNAERHAHAGQVRVAFGCGAHACLLQVEDNGVGFDTRLARKQKTYGLLALRERAHAVGGELTVSSAPPGSGTVVSVRIPVRHLSEPGRQ